MDDEYPNHTIRQVELKGFIIIFPRQLSQSLFEFHSQPSHIFQQYLVDIVTTHIGTW